MQEVAVLAAVNIIMYIYRLMLFTTLGLNASYIQAWNANFSLSFFVH